MASDVRASPRRRHTSADVCAELGIGIRQLRRLEKLGLPHTPGAGGLWAGHRYDCAEAREWYERGRAAKGKRGSTRAAATPEAAPAPVAAAGRIAPELERIGRAGDAAADVGAVDALVRELYGYALAQEVDEEILYVLDLLAKRRRRLFASAIAGPLMELATAVEKLFPIIADGSGPRETAAHFAAIERGFSAIGKALKAEWCERCAREANDQTKKKASPARCRGAGNRADRAATRAG